MSPVIAAEQSEQQENFVPSQNLIQQFKSILCKPQMLPDVDTQNVEIIDLKNDRVDLQWTWRSKIEHSTPSVSQKIKKSSKERIQAIDTKTGMVLTSRPIKQVDIDNLIPTRDKRILATIKTKKLTIQEAHWLVSAFKDNTLYQEITLLNRLFSDILEGKISAKGRTLCVPESSKTFVEYENKALVILLNFLNEAIASRSTVNRLQLLSPVGQGIMFGARYSTGNSNFILSDLNQAKWFFDVLSLHPAFPDASAFRTLIDLHSDSSI
jgi:hypothetical protein